MVQFAEDKVSVKKDDSTEEEMPNMRKRRKSKNKLDSSLEEEEDMVRTRRSRK